MRTWYQISAKLLSELIKSSQIPWWWSQRRSPKHWLDFYSELTRLIAQEDFMTQNSRSSGISCKYRGIQKSLCPCKNKFWNFKVIQYSVHTRPGCSTWLVCVTHTSNNCSYRGIVTFESLCIRIAHSLSYQSFLYWHQFLQLIINSCVFLYVKYVQSQRIVDSLTLFLTIEFILRWTPAHDRLEIDPSGLRVKIIVHPCVKSYFQTEK